MGAHCEDSTTCNQQTAAHRILFCKGRLWLACRRQRLAEMDDCKQHLGADGQGMFKTHVFLNQPYFSSKANAIFACFLLSHAWVISQKQKRRCAECLTVFSCIHEYLFPHSLRQKRQSAETELIDFNAWYNA